MSERLSDEQLALTLDTAEVHLDRYPRHVPETWRSIILALLELRERRAAEAPKRRFQEVFIDSRGIPLEPDDLARKVAEERSEDGCGCD